MGIQKAVACYGSLTEYDYKYSSAELAEIVGQVAVELAHNIRNPLTVIKGYLQVLQARSAGYSVESVATMLQEINYIEELVHNLLVLSPKKIVDKQVVDLNRLLIKSLPKLQQECRAFGVDVSLMAANVPLCSAINGEEFARLLLHLVRNAAEASFNDDIVMIAITREFDQVVIYIKDDGVGIAPEVIDQIFVPFYSTKTGNAGLGLTAAASITQRHQGTLQVASELSRGTIVRLALPLVKNIKGAIE